MASFLYNQNQLIEAQAYYEKLLSLADSETDRAGVLNDLGNVYSKNNQFKEALQAYSEALDIRKQLAEKNPVAFLQYVANSQNNLGLLYLSLNRLEDARETLSQAVATREQLTLKNPRAFEIDLCQSLIALGGYVHRQLLEETGDLSHLEKAASLLDNAIERLEKYPEVPRAIKYLKDAQDFKQRIDKAKEMLKK